MKHMYQWYVDGDGNYHMVGPAESKGEAFGRILLLVALILIIIGVLVGLVLLGNLG